jgi:ketosteroid isomerase-like protein
MGVITRVAGTTGVRGSGGDDAPATDAQLDYPSAVAKTADGGFLIADTGNYVLMDEGNQVVRKVSVGGVITRVAGTTGVIGSGGDDGLATDAQLNYPSAVAVTADGGFLIADTYNQVVRKVSVGGMISRVAGTTGASGSGGDDGPATDAQLRNPTGVAVTADGGFLIADTGNHVVRKVSADGMISRVAGTTGASGSGGDDGPATDAQLNGPTGVVATVQGWFLIADTGNQVVRKVSADGVISRVAGTTGASGSGGDDGPATDAQLNGPTGVAVTAVGGFLIADTGNQVVREVSQDGVITRVAGTTGASGSGGDDGPATDAQLNYPSAVAVTADGGFLIADTGNRVVRKVEPNG